MTKSAAPRMNVKLLRRIQRHILEEPKRFQMGRFCIVKDEDNPRVIDRDANFNTEFSFARCGTAACIGGWGMLLSGMTVKQVSSLDCFRDTAAKKLRLSAEQAWRLFYVENWAKPYASLYGEAKTPAGRARVAFNRINHFISTKGAE